MLKKETIEELKNILEEECGERISMREATETANTLVAYFDLLAKVYYRHKIKKKQNRK